MEKFECPQCGGPLGNEATVCGECGKEINVQPPSPAQEEKRSGKNLYAFLAVLLVVLCGVAMLLFTGLIPNPLRDSSTAAIVNGEKISLAELDKKLDMYKKMYGQGGKADFSSPDGKKMLEQMSRQVLDSLIQNKILATEARKEKISVSPQEITERINAIKKSMNLSDKDFEEFLKNHSMNLSSFEKRVEKDLMIARLIAKGADKGLTKEAWIKELNSRAKVEIFSK